MKTVFQSKSAFFSLGVVAGIMGFWGVLSLGYGSQTGDYASAPPAAVLPAENASTPPAAVFPAEKVTISYSGASILVWKGDTDSSLNNYQLERDACCTGAK